MDSICKGNAVLLDIPSPASPHLFFVMIPPTGEPPVTVLVNISTVRNHRYEDHTVILTSEDHPYIKHDSYVAYDCAAKRRVDIIENDINKNPDKLFDDISNDVYQRILDGLYLSPNTPGNIKSICRKFL